MLLCSVSCVLVRIQRCRPTRWPEGRFDMCWLLRRILIHMTICLIGAYVFGRSSVVVGGCFVVVVVDVEYSVYVRFVCAIIQSESQF